MHNVVYMYSWIYIVVYFVTFECCCIALCNIFYMYVQSAAMNICLRTFAPYQTHSDCVYTTTTNNSNNKQTTTKS